MNFDSVNKNTNYLEIQILGIEISTVHFKSNFEKYCGETNIVN